MELLALPAIAFAAGALAQRWKRRLGVAWFAVALALQVAVLLFAGAVQMLSPDLAGRRAADVAVVVLAAVIGGGLSLAIVATLPKRG